MSHDYTSCTWFQGITNSKESDSDPQTLGDTNFLTDNQTKRFLERYFDAFYVLDCGSQPRNDLCLLRHSNGLCVVGLAPGNHIFRGCYPQGLSDENTEPKEHCILGLDFQVSDHINRLRNHVQGRRKHGGHVLQTPQDIIAYAVCDQGIRHPIQCAIPGRLLEVNTKIAISNSSEQQSDPDQNRLTALGGSNLDAMGTFICILIPNLVSRHCGMQKFGSHPKLSKHAAVAPESDDQSNLETVDSHHNQIELGTQGQDLDFCSKLVDNFGLTVIRWDDYCKLRNIQTV